MLKSFFSCLVGLVSLEELFLKAWNKGKKAGYPFKNFITFLILYPMTVRPSFCFNLIVAFAFLYHLYILTTLLMYAELWALGELTVSDVRIDMQF